MTPQPTHLTDEQLSDCLGDTIPAAARRHLDTCTLCRDELAALRSSLDAFNDLSLSWAATRAPARIPVPSRAALRWQRLPVRSAIAATLTAVVFLSAAHRHTHRLPLPAAPQIGSQVASASPEEDDRLLLAIDGEIRAARQSPVSASELDLPQAATAPTDRSLSN